MKRMDSVRHHQPSISFRRCDESRCGQVNGSTSDEDSFLAPLLILDLFKVITQA